jgi:hypothetical protein
VVLVMAADATVYNGHFLTHRVQQFLSKSKSIAFITSYLLMITAQLCRFPPYPISLGHDPPLGPLAVGSVALALKDASLVTSQVH